MTIKRFNESLESGIPTHAELLDMVDNGNIKLVNVEEVELLKDILIV